MTTAMETTVWGRLRELSRAGTPFDAVWKEMRDDEAAYRMLLGWAYSHAARTGHALVEERATTPKAVSTRDDVLAWHDVVRVATDQVRSRGRTETELLAGLFPGKQLRWLPDLERLLYTVNAGATWDHGAGLADWLCGEADRLHVDRRQVLLRWGCHHAVVAMDMRRMRVEMQDSILLELSQDLLDTPFALGGGRRATWGDASRIDHEERYELLAGQASGTFEAALRHAAAVRLLERTGAKSLRVLAQQEVQ